MPYRAATTPPLSLVTIDPGRGFWSDPGNDWIRFIPYKGGAYFKGPFRAAWQKGFLAGYARHPQSLCPYRKTVNKNGRRSSWGFAFRRAWIKGHKAGARARQRRTAKIWPFPPA